MCEHSEEINTFRTQIRSLRWNLNSLSQFLKYCKLEIDEKELFENLIPEFKKLIIGQGYRYAELQRKLSNNYIHFFICSKIINDLTEKGYLVYKNGWFKRIK
jgi:hypothetical protein